MGDQGRMQQAQALLEETLATLATTAGLQDTEVTPRLELDLGGLLYRRGSIGEAIGHLQPLLAHYAKVPGMQHIVMTRLARPLIEAGRLDEAASLLEASRGLLVDDRGEHSLAFANWLAIGAELALARQDPRRAMDLLEQSETAWSAPAGERASGLGLRRRWLRVEALLLLGESSRAVAEMRPTLADVIASSPAPDEEARARQELGRVLQQAGRCGEAAAELGRVVAIRESIDPPSGHWLAAARAFLSGPCPRLSELAPPR